MKRRNWKHAQPSSLRQALEWCKEHARERHNLSVERIAERMGLPDHSALYKWLANGRMPAVLIPVYERVCGINLVSRWLAATAGKVLIDVPTGRAATAHDTQRLQEILTETSGAVLAFYAGKNDVPETLAALQNALEELAWHRGNVQQHANPQLELGEQP
ncbi:hypothetical protein [Stutzerimonas kirkiae]|uniref:hypothetical protein n=1 Tax=Stutzerimonas kirkiae TaxID=2211392 RepID=UPI0010383540|nr:hypothetical protein [Stutzerimonas kirkiae]TBV10233.1 hypothetical protein DNK08_07080 [Stutzerimonas kirkiae]